MRPNPSTPSLSLLNRRMGAGVLRDHSPRRSRSCVDPSWRCRASNMPMAWTATSSTQYCGVLRTLMPRSATASKSTLSRPVPYRCSNLQLPGSRPIISASMGAMQNISASMQGVEAIACFSLHRFSSTESVTAIPAEESAIPARPSRSLSGSRSSDTQSHTSTCFCIDVVSLISVLPPFSVFLSPHLLLCVSVRCCENYNAVLEF